MEIIRGIRSNRSRKITKQRQQTKRKQYWKYKKLHGHVIRDKEDIANIKLWNWLRNIHLKRETEWLITSAQNLYIRTNVIKMKIDGTSNDPKSRMCKTNDETITHIISECPKLLQKNTNDKMTGWERLCIGIFVETKVFNVPKK